MITMQFVVGTLAKRLHYVAEDELLPSCRAVSQRGRGMEKTCYYEAYVRKHIFGKLGMHDTGFLPSESSYARIAPTWVDNDYRHEIMQVRGWEHGSA